jgi:hypothetical protein
MSPQKKQKSLLDPSFVVLVIRCNNHVLVVSHKERAWSYQFPMTVLEQGESREAAALRKLKDMVGDLHVQLKLLGSFASADKPECTGHVFFAHCERTPAERPGVTLFKLTVWDMMMRQERTLQCLETVGAWGFYCATRNGSRY